MSRSDSIRTKSSAARPVGRIAQGGGRAAGDRRAQRAPVPALSFRLSCATKPGRHPAPSWHRLVCEDGAFGRRPASDAPRRWPPDHGLAAPRPSASSSTRACSGVVAGRMVMGGAVTWSTGSTGGRRDSGPAVSRRGSSDLGARERGRNEGGLWSGMAAATPPASTPRHRELITRRERLTDDRRHDRCRPREGGRGTRGGREAVRAECTCTGVKTQPVGGACCVVVPFGAAREFRGPRARSRISATRGPARMPAPERAPRRRGGCNWAGTARPGTGSNEGSASENLALAEGRHAVRSEMGEGAHDSRAYRLVGRYARATHHPLRAGRVRRRARVAVSNSLVKNVSPSVPSAWRAERSRAKPGPTGVLGCGNETDDVRARLRKPAMSRQRQFGVTSR